MRDDHPVMLLTSIQNKEIMAACPPPPPICVAGLPEEHNLVIEIEASLAKIQKIDQYDLFDPVNLVECGVTKSLQLVIH